MSRIKKASKIKLFLMDVDGVLTDGKMYFFQDSHGKNHETKAFNAQDGIGLILLNKFGIKTGVITGRESIITEERAKMLSMSYAYQGFLSKISPLEEIALAEKLNMGDIAYMGDDVTDIPVLKKVGFSCCPSNAMPEVKRVCDFVSTRNGGDGAVREVCDIILKDRGFSHTVKRGVENAEWPEIKKEKLKVVLYSKRKGGK